MGLFDVHAHLTDRRLAEQEQAVVDRARAAGVTTIISNGLNIADNRATLALAERHDIIKAAIGLYPVDAVLPEMVAMGVEYPRDTDGPVPSADEGVAWVAAHVDEAFAVGEVGLDHYWVPEALWERQEQVFRRLIRIARAADKVLIVHTRKAERRTLEVLLEEKATRVNWHCFGGKLKLAQEIAAAGHWMSIPANARKSDGFRRMLQNLPRERILLETDCPYLGPVRGELNEPANVQVTADFAAELWGETPASVSAQMAENFCALFGVNP